MGIRHQQVQNQKINTRLEAGINSSSIKKYVNQIAACANDLLSGSWLSRLPFTKNKFTSKLVHDGLQVRPVGQAGYPISLVASLDTVPVKCCVPLR